MLLNVLTPAMPGLYRLHTPLWLTSLLHTVLFFYFFFLVEINAAVVVVVVVVVVVGVGVLFKKGFIPPR